MAEPVAPFEHCTVCQFPIDVVSFKRVTGWHHRRRFWFDGNYYYPNNNHPVNRCKVEGCVNGKSCSKGTVMTQQQLAAAQNA